MEQRTFDVLLNKPDYRDITSSEVRSTIAAYTPAPRSYKTNIDFLPTYDQKNKGACVEFADGKYGGGYLTYKRINKLIEPSARFGYAVSHVYGNLPWTVQGTQPRDYANVMLKAGLPTVEVVPDDLDLPLQDFSTLDVSIAMVNSGIPNRVQGVAVVKNSWSDIKQDIFDNGFITMTVDVGDWNTGEVKPPSPYYPSRGRHRVFIYGYDEPVDGTYVLYGRNSWGKNWGFNGEFKMSYNDYAPYIYDIFTYPPQMPIDLIAEARAKTIKPAYSWQNNLSFGMTNTDVKRYQEVLRYEGLIDASQPATGYYGNITRGATLEFQQRYGVSSLAILFGLLGRNVGPATRKVLNANFGPQYGTYSSKIVTWAKAIQSREGYFAPGENPNYPNGTPAWRNKNPGNLTDAPYYHTLPGFIGVSSDHDFCMWVSYDAGFNALCDKLQNACTGKSTVYFPTDTLLQFFEKYAPKSDGNDPFSYATEVALKCGVTVDTPISAMLG